MTDDIYSMTKSGFHEAIRQAKEEAWEEGRLSYRDDLAGTPSFGTPGYKESTNPYRSAQ